ncbi:hypothetical protein FAF44_09140 [Nonomuraea sp. MG754425]|uniref:hypothetical protein n=1 Tax=Nonomuraea sp. MG754425 TaxID=2570319 RepID=UPI001F17FF28|nr:hypothetical protein [Nonomuraea sp. MG754425]MCF6468550.1 hypothetical protein [Nonomuraea sp. MG754425]
MSCHDANFVRAGRIESRVLTDGDPGKRQRWNPRTGERTRLAAAGAVAGADRTWLATPRAQTVRLTNLKDGSVLDIGLKDGAGPQGAWNAGTVTVSGDGKLLASITDDEVQFRRMADAQLLTTVPLLSNADIGGEQPQGAFERRTFRYLIEDRVFSIDL